VRDDDEVSEALRRAASELLLRGGVEALTVRRVAQEAGTTTMAIYSRFGGKEGLLGELYREGFALVAAAQQGVRRTESPRADLLRLTLAYRRVALAHPAHYRLMFGDATGWEPGALAREAALPTFEVLVTAVSRAIEAEEIQGDAEEIALAVFACCHGLVGLELASLTPARGRAPRYRRALEALLDGFA